MIREILGAFTKNLFARLNLNLLVRVKPVY